MLYKQTEISKNKFHYIFIKSNNESKVPELLIIHIVNDSEFYVAN